MTAAVLITGNPIDGFTFVGPYDSEADAAEAAEDVTSDTWFTATVQDPPAPPPAHRRTNVRCEAVLSAFENLRDSSGLSDAPAMSIGAAPTLIDVFAEAAGYVIDGMSTCTCEPR